VTHRRRHDDGQSTVEFALVLPVMVLLLVAMIDIAALASDQLRADGLARDAARVASTARGVDEARDTVADVVGSSTARVTSFDSAIHDGVITVRVRVEPRVSNVLGILRWFGQVSHVVGEASFATEYVIDEQ
jgi:Flp pilus assembly protein TadG